MERLYSRDMNTRKGYRAVCWQLPIVLLERLEADAKAIGGKVGPLLALILCKHYGIDPDTLPQAQKPGPKPKPADEAPPKPKKGRKKP